MNPVDLAELGLRALYELVHDDAMNDLLDAAEQALKTAAYPDRREAQ